MHICYAYGGVAGFLLPSSLQSELSHMIYCWSCLFCLYPRFYSSGTKRIVQDEFFLCSACSQTGTAWLVLCSVLGPSAFQELPILLIMGYFFMAHCWPMLSMISLVASVCLLCSWKTLSPTLKPQHPFCLQLKVTAWHLQAVHPVLVVSSASNQYRQQGCRLLTENRFKKKNLMIRLLCKGFKNVPERLDYHPAL